MSSKRRQRRNACEGKIQYPTKQAAVDQAYGLQRREGERWVGAYHCKFGDHWHIGHLDARQRRASLARTKHRRRVG